MAALESRRIGALGRQRGVRDACRALGACVAASCDEGVAFTDIELE